MTAPELDLGQGTKISITVENHQIIDNNTLRIDLSFNGIVRQDGKEIELEHERQTIYVNKKRGPVFEMYGVTPRVDPRQKGKQ